MSGSEHDDEALTAPAASASATGPAAGTRWARYQVLESLGEGGMGSVHAAHDDELDRTVALKVLHDELLGRASQERLRREARAMARVAHPNVVPVYDVGEHNGRSYYTMELVRGQSLQDWLAEPRPWSEVQRVFLDAARGLTAIHAAGLVHGDVKPGNLLLGDDGRARVTDLGIALSDPMVPGKAPLLTTTTLRNAGTPAYMAPEQLRGGAGEARADQFAFGVTLFEALHGEAPFGRGTIVDRIAAIESTPPSGTREVPGWLAKVVRRAIAADPAARFADMAALTRALEGPRLRQRWPWMVAIGVAAAGAAAASVVALQSGDDRDTERLRLAQQVGQEMQQIEADLRVAYMLPLHDVRPEQARAKERMQALERTLAKEGDLGAGAGEYALGRGYLALHDIDKAVSHLLAAEDRGYHTPEVELALGRAMGLSYERQLIRVDAITDSELREAKRAAAERRWRDPALQHLRAANDPADYVQALIATYAGRDHDALALAERAVAHGTWTYEAQLLVSDLHFLRASDAVDRGEHEAAFTELEQAAATQEGALVIGRSDPWLHGRVCDRLQRVAGARLDRGDDLEVAYQEAVAGCARARACDPDRISPLENLGLVYVVWGYHQLGIGKPIDETTEYALAVLGRARELAPGDGEVLEYIGNVFKLQALAAINHGDDVYEAVEAAVAAYQQAAELDPDSWAPELAATVLLLRAEAEINGSRDPTATIERAVAAVRHLQTDVAQIVIRDALVILGDWEQRHGQDPRPTLDRAVQAHQQVDGVLSRDANFVGDAAYMWYVRALYERSAGLDGAASYRRAIALTEEALGINARLDMWSNLGGFRVDLAANERQQGRDPLPHLVQARSDFERAAELDDTSLAVWQNLAALHLGLAQVLLDRGEDPAAELGTVREQIERGRQIQQEALYLDLGEAEIATIEGAWQERQHRSPLVAYASAIAATDRVLAMDRDDHGVHLQKAELLYRVAAWKQRAGKDAAADLDSALAAVQEMMDQGNTVAPLSVLRGRLYRLRALASDSAADAAESIAAFDRAAAVAPATVKPYMHDINDMRVRLRHGDPPPPSRKGRRR